MTLIVKINVPVKKLILYIKLPNYAKIILQNLLLIHRKRMFLLHNFFMRKNKKKLVCDKIISFVSIFRSY